MELRNRKIDNTVTEEVTDNTIDNFVDTEISNNTQEVAEDDFAKGHGGVFKLVNGKRVKVKNEVE